jgi:hypothetical protein
MSILEIPYKDIPKVQRIDRAEAAAVAMRNLPLGVASALIADADNVIDGRLRFASAMAQANLARRYRRPIKPNGPA